MSSKQRQKLKDFLNDLRPKSGKVKSSRNLDSCKPTPPTTSDSCVEPQEAGPDQEIIRKYPWAVYSSASTSEKEALELAILVEVAKSSNRSPGNHGPAVNQKLCSDLLRDNQEFRAVFLSCWKRGSFQYLHSNDAFQPLSSQPIAVDVGSGGSVLNEGKGAEKHRPTSSTVTSSQAGGQTINIQGSTFGGNVQLKQIFSSDDHESKIPEWLSSLEYSETHNGLRQKRTPGTGSWFLNSEEFKSWINRPDRNVLWCPGIPGAGKTIIASLVIDHLREHAQDTAVLYVYFTYKLHDHQNLNTSVQTLSRQVHEICRRKEIPSDFKQLYISHLEHKTRPAMDELLGALRTTLKHFKQVYVVLDALDEYLKNYSDAKIRQLLTTVKSFGDHAKIFATSRNIGQMENLFGDLNAIKEEIVADSKDLETFVNAGIATLDHFDVSTQLLQQVIQKVEEAADGRFLMAELHMNALVTLPTIGDLKQSLNSLSSQVDRTYQLAMERIDALNGRRKELAKETLMWVAYTRRPMKVGELQHALATKHGRENIADFLPSASTITSTCIGLVVIENGNVAFVHLTTQEFFDEHQARYFPEAHKEIGRTCLDYILLPCFLDFAPYHLSNFQHANDFEESYALTHLDNNNLYKSYPFYDYAALNWGFHVNRYGEDEALAESILVVLKQVDDRLKLAWTHTLRSMEISRDNDDVGLDGAGLFLALYHQQKASFLALIDKAHIPTTKKQRTPFIIAAHLGLPDFIELMVQIWGADNSHSKQDHDDSRMPQPEEPDNNRANVASADIDGETPLSYAARNGQTAVIELLLQYPATEVNSPNKIGCTPLLHAASMGLDDTVRLLVKHEGVNVNHQDREGCTALIAAARGGYSRTVKLLLQHPLINISLCDEDKWTAFIFAVKNGHASVVEHLLERPGNYINNQWALYGRQTALMAAASRDDQYTTELLLKCPELKINLKDNNGKTALHIAAEEGSHNVVKLLLEHPAIDVSLTDRYRVSPFLAALKRGNASTLKPFLDHEKLAQLVGSIQDTVGRNTALSIAALKGYLQVVELLLNYTDIDPDIRTGQGCSPLTLASEYGHADIVQLLLDRASININNIDNDGDTPLICAAYNGHTSVARLLLHQPGIQVNVQDRRGCRTALSRACDASKAPATYGEEKTEAEAYSFVELLLEHKDIDINLADEAGKTPLYYASRSGFQRVVELMQRRGAVMSGGVESTTTNGPLLDESNYQDHGGDDNDVVQSHYRSDFVILYPRLPDD